MGSSVRSTVNGAAGISEGSQAVGAESHPSKNEGWGTRLIFYADFFGFGLNGKRFNLFLSCCGCRWKKFFETPSRKLKLLAFATQQLFSSCPDTTAAVAPSSE
jgi:hypothetical protein